MDADLMSVSNDATHEIGVVDGGRTDHKKRGMDVVFPKDVQDSGRPDRVRAVVERQGERADRRTHRTDRPAAGIDHRAALGHRFRYRAGRPAPGNEIIPDPGKVVHVSLHREGNTQRKQDGHEDKPMGL
jgi:hypothetical protein